MGEAGPPLQRPLWRLPSHVASVESSWPRATATSAPLLRTRNPCAKDPPELVRVENEAFGLQFKAKQKRGAEAKAAIPQLSSRPRFFMFGGEAALVSKFRIHFVGPFSAQPVICGFSVVEGNCPPLFSVQEGAGSA